VGYLASGEPSIVTPTIAMACHPAMMKGSQHKGG
jgi:hypothetical protein